MSRPLRVGLNLVYLVEGSGGTGTYARELIPALLAVEPETRITAFVGRGAPADVREAPWASDVDWVTFPVDYDYGRPWNPLMAGAAQWAALPWIAARRRVDVVHGLANVAPLAAPRVARVVTLLDLIWLHFPRTMTRRATLSMKWSALPSARASDRVIAISHAAKRDLVASVGLPPDKIDVTPLGVRAGDLAEPAPDSDLRAELELGRSRVVLCVAQKREHKNLARLIRAVAGLDDDVKLVLVGAPTPHEQELRALAEQLRLGNRIRFPGWLTDAQLERLYRLAAVFVLPSLQEGFGLPLLEAMRRSVPVACSAISSLPEVAGDAAVLFDPFDVDDIRTAIARVLGEPGLADRLIAAGHERCRQYTWETTARATLESYRRAIAARRLTRSAGGSPHAGRGARPGDLVRLTRPYAKLCDRRDFEDPELRAAIRDVVPARRAEDELERKLWEYGMLALFLRDVGALTDQADVLAVGAGSEEPLFWLANRVRRVVATDIYGEGDFAYREARSTMLTDPAGFAPYPYREDHLEVRWMDARELEFPDATFDAVFSLSSIEHFGHAGDIARAAAEVGRVLRPGGHALIVTECLLGRHLLDSPLVNTAIRALTLGHRCPDATPRNRQVDSFTPAELQRRIVEPSGLRLVQPLDLDLSPETFENVTRIYPDGRLEPASGRRHPHIVLRAYGAPWTSVCLPLEKPGG